MVKFSKQKRLHKQYSCVETW
uniref:Uncharacterized protein n=1 Tax=Anguilla anguilla TaxID=7936 RepID=A0A0E9UH29_ANGAN